MYCKNCGEKLNEGVNFCFKCGFKAGDGNGYCDKCGVKVNSATCDNCGNIIENYNKDNEFNNNQNYSSNYNNQGNYNTNYNNQGYNNNTNYNNNPNHNPNNGVRRPKSRIAAGILGILVGGLGIHRFYLGYIGIGIIQIVVTILTCGAGSLWGFIEGILILCGTTITADADGMPLSDN